MDSRPFVVFSDRPSTPYTPRRCNVRVSSTTAGRHWFRSSSSCGATGGRRGPRRTPDGCKSPQTNGICERFHKTVLQEFYQVAFRKKLYGSLEQLQQDLDEWLDRYNEQRTHQGKMCCGRTPRETFNDGMRIWKEKMIGDVAA